MCIRDRFYVIKAGVCAIEVEGVGKVKEIPSGGYFGELALLYDAPRSASVRATTDVTCYALDQGTFNGLIERCTAKLVAPLKQLQGITLSPPDAHYERGAFLGDGMFAAGPQKGARFHCHLPTLEWFSRSHEVSREPRIHSLQSRP